MTKKEQFVTVALRTIVGVLLVAGLATAIVSSVRHLSAEVIIETCSFVAALTLIGLERRHATHVSRSIALRNIVHELGIDAEHLCGEFWLKPCEAVVEEYENVQAGLRHYYPPVAAAATRAALLSGALDYQSDAKLIRALHEWETTALACNTRLTMAEFHLFFLPADSGGMKERLRIHASIASEPVTKQRARLTSLLELLGEYGKQSRLPKGLEAEVEDIASKVLSGTIQAKAIVDELWKFIGGFEADPASRNDRVPFYRSEATSEVGASTSEVGAS